MSKSCFRTRWSHVARVTPTQTYAHNKNHQIITLRPPARHHPRGHASFILSRWSVITACGYFGGTRARTHASATRRDLTPTLRRCVPSVERGAQGSCVSANTKRECIELEPKKSAPLTRDRSGHSQHNLSARGIAEAMTIGAVRSKASKAIFSHH